MNRTASLVMAFVMILSLIAAAPAAVAGLADATVLTNDDSGETNTETVENESDVRLGERLSGIVGVQEAEIDGEIESRAYGLTIAKAATDEAKADAVAQKLQANAERMEAHEQRLEELREQRESGEIREGEYRSKSAKIAVQLETVERTTNQSSQATDGLPAALLEERGIDAAAIEQLRQNASELRGGAVTVAGGIAGERPESPAGSPGERPGSGGGSDRGMSGEVTHSNDRTVSV